MIGAGYVGLVSAACFADFGWTVTCVDKERDRVEGLKRGQIPIYEPGLDDLVAHNVAAGRILFTTSVKDAVQDADVIFLAVGTPMRRQNLRCRSERAARLSAGCGSCVPT